MADLVTGEAVVLELRLAKLASRSIALALDLTVQIVLLVAVTIGLSGALSQVDSALGAAMGIAAMVIVVIGYPVAWETASRGRSLGKLALGLRVVRDDGGPIGFRHALVRALLSVVEVWITFGSLALITSLASQRGKRLGDLLAGTVVVRERVPLPSAPVADMPAPLAGWAAGLDLSRLSDGLALEVRYFLARHAELAPAVREAMGARLAATVAALTAPPPPPGTPPWAFLAAVLAERRRRELGRAPQAQPQPPAAPLQAPAAPPAAPPATTGPGDFAPPG